MTNSIELYKLKLKTMIEAKVELTWNELEMSRATFMTLNKHDILPIQAGQMQRMIQALDSLADNNLKQICKSQLKLIAKLEHIAIFTDDDNSLTYEAELAIEALKDVLEKGAKGD